MGFPNGHFHKSKSFSFPSTTVSLVQWEKTASSPSTRTASVTIPGSTKCNLRFVAGSASARAAKVPHALTIIHAVAAGLPQGALWEGHLFFRWGIPVYSLDLFWCCIQPACTEAGANITSMPGSNCFRHLLINSLKARE